MNGLTVIPSWLWQLKLEKDKREHPLTAWDPQAKTGKNYDEGIRYIISKFVALNKDPANRQVLSS